MNIPLEYQNLNYQQILNQINTNALNTYYFAFDMETGGFNDATSLTDKRIPKNQVGATYYPILEVSAIMYNGNFEKIGEPLTLVIYQDQKTLDERVSDWSKAQFANTLMIQCPKSEITLEKASELMAEYIDSFVKDDEDARVLMLGNSIRLDMDFVSIQMPKLKEKLHYQLLDVSTLKRIFNCLFGDFAYFHKEATHEAQTDIEESIAELAFYRKHFIYTREAFVRSILNNSEQANIAKNI